MPEQNVLDIGLYLGAQLGWVDVSADGRQGVADSGGGITITRRENAPGTMDLVLANPGGRYSPRNPRSDLYGLLGRNTPVRVGLVELDEAFTAAATGTWAASGWSTWGAGGSLTSADFGADGGSAWHRVPIANAYRGTHYTGRRWQDCEVRTTFTIPADVTGGTLEPANLLLRLQDVATYYMARVEVTASETVSVSLHHSSAGTIAAPVAVPGLVHAGQPLSVAASCVGDRLAMKVWDPAAGGEPRDWQVTGVDTRLRAAGYVGVRSGVAGGNTNTRPVEFRYHDLRVVDRRACMEVASWPPRWNTAGTDTWVPVQAAGILRRLNQGAKPLDSALFRYLTQTGPTAYWPLEDPAGSLQARSAVAGIPPLTTFGYSRFTVPGTGAPEPAANLPVFGAGNGIPGSHPVVDLAQGGVLQASLPYSPWANWRIEWVAISPRDKGDIVIPVRWSTDGSWPRWDIQIEPTGIFATFGSTDGTNAGTASNSSLNLYDGLPHHFRIEASDIGGGTVSARIWVDGVQVATFSMFGSPLSGTAGSITQVVLNPLEIQQNAPESQAMPILGHLAVWNPPAAATDTTTAMRGHAGETAADRIERLCAEHGVPVLVSRGPDPSAAMGPQRPATLLALLRECEDADGGILGEAREQLALTYRCLGSLYNQAPVVIPYSYLVPPLEPTDDDDHVRNDVTASRPDGGTARAVLEAGPLSTLPPPAGVGTYDTSVTVNVATDEQLPDQAGWRLHVGTWDEARYPTARVDLAAPVWAGSGDLAAAVTALTAGDVVALDELPVWLPPGPAAEMVRASVERLDEYTRELDWTLTPAGPYTVAEADGDPRVPADGSTLAADLTEAGTSLLLASTAANGPWTTDPADMPLDMLVGGEQVVASAIGPGVVDSFTRSLAGWGAADTGQTWTTSGGSPSDYTVDTARGVMSQGTVGTLRTALLDVGASDATITVDTPLVPTPTGAPSTYWTFVRATDLNNHYIARLDVAPGGATSLTLFKRVDGLLSGLGATVSLSPNIGGTWRLVVDYHGSSLLAKAWRFGTDSEPGWLLTATDTSLTTGTLAGVGARLEAGNTTALPVLARWDNFLVSNPQLVAVSARGVNGVTRAWPAGTGVDVQAPAVLAL